MRSFEHGYLADTPISQSLLMVVRSLGEFRGRQMLYNKQSPEVLDTLRRVAMIQSAESSNRIEGITAERARIERSVLKTTKPQNRPEQEIAGYRDVLGIIHANSDSLTLSTNLILDLHRRMHRYVSEKGGLFKSKDNAIIEIQPDGRKITRFRPVSALQTPKFIEKLIRHLIDTIDSKEADPLLLVASFILDFECIHPFSDGNGRIGRLLTLLLLYQNGYEVGRYIGLERIVEESKESYYEALYKSSQGWHEAKHDLRPWWNYFLGMLTAAYNEFESRVGSITSAKGAKREMVQNTIKNLSPQFKISDVQRLCPGVSYPTIKRALADLSKEGKLRCMGKGRDAQWERIGS